MAITNIDQLLAGFDPAEMFVKVTGTMEAAGQPHSLFYAAGIPGAAAVPSPGLAGAILTSYAGQLPVKAPPVGQSKYLARAALGANATVAFQICDRLWHNSGIVVTTTTEQLIGSPAWPNRDADGTSLGRGVQIALEVSTITGNGGAVTNSTVRYTNSDGVSGRTATLATGYAFPATAEVGTFVPFLLQAGDTGVRSIEGITLGTSLVSGAVHLVAYRPVASLCSVVQNGVSRDDAVSLGLPRLWDAPVLFVLVTPNATTTTTVRGLITLATG